jgi:hypothetical protein
VHRPYRIPYSVQVKARNEEPRWESRVAHISARNPRNAERRLAKRLDDLRFPQ